MKTKVTMISVFCFIMLVAVNVSLSAQSNDLKKMAGKWSYSQENPMDGSKMDGSCVIAIANNEDHLVTATIASPMGEMTTSPLVSDDKGKYYGTITTDFGDIKLTFSWKGEILLQEMSFDSPDAPAFPAIEMKRAQ